MYSILLSLLIGALLGVAFQFGSISNIWFSIVWGLLTAVAAYILLAWRLRKAVMKPMQEIQDIMLSSQQQMMQRLNVLQSKPVGSPNQVMKEIEKMQKVAIGNALGATDRLDPFAKWVPLMARQIATIRMQFHYQLKDFKKVEELLPKCLMLEPLSMAMRLAHMYRSKEDLEAIRKVFDRSVIRLKYNQGVLLYSLMAWILVQKKEDAEAHKLLLEAAKQTENETVKRNLERLQNNRAREFSNAGLGDEWYALHLEQPKVNVRRQQPRFHGRPF